MKPIMPSNWKAPRRVLCTLLLGITALWAMPRSARAQLYVSNSNAVGKYNATTGAPINANFITGLGAPVVEFNLFVGGLALSGNNLFVASGGFFGSAARVGKYDATMGVAINANFITGTSGQLALSGDGTALFVVNSGNTPTSTVGKYNATTGAAINANFITGLGAPVGIALSGNNLFVGTISNPLNTVGEYNATTGAAINANFITGSTPPTDSRCRPTALPSSWSTT
jgi:hypothetical protein